MAGEPAELAETVASLAPMHSALDVISVAEAADVKVRHAAEVYFGISRALDLDWLLDQVDRLKVEGHWQAKARGSLRDNLFGLQRVLATRVICDTGQPNAAAAIKAWTDSRRDRVEHLQQTITDMHNAGPLDFATGSVALQEIRRLAEG
ncbi:MAG: NAD-glutamate dehydrogenase [Gammaproteobacteria bacterium]